MLSSNRIQKKKKGDSLENSEFSSAKKPKKDEFGLPDPTVGLSRSGRIRKKSAKFMEMEEDFHDLDELAEMDDDSVDISRSGRIRKKSLKLIDSVTDFDIEPFKKSKLEKNSKSEKNLVSKKHSNYLHSSNTHHEHKLKIPIYPHPSSISPFSLSHKTSTPLHAHITDNEDSDDDLDDEDDDDELDDDEDDDDDDDLYIEESNKKKFTVSGKDSLKKKLFPSLPPLTIGIPDTEKSMKKNKKKNVSSIDTDSNVTVKESNSGIRLKLILSPKEKLLNQSEADLSSVDVSHEYLEQPVHEKSNKIKKNKVKNQTRLEIPQSRGFYQHDINAIGGSSFENPDYNEKGHKIPSKKKKKKKHTKKGKFSDESPDLCYNADDDDFSNLVIAEEKDIPKKKKKVKKTKKTKHSESKVEDESAFFDSAEEKFGIESDESEEFINIPSSESIHSDRVPSSFKIPQIFVEKKMNKKTKESKSKTKKEQNQIKAKPKKPRPMTAYMLWCQSYRKKVVSDNPEMDFAAISKKLGEIWQSLPEKEKMAWRRKAKKQSNKGSTIISTGKPQVPNSSKTPVVKTQVKPDDSQISPFKGNGTSPIDVAAHLKLLGESLSIIGQRLTEHEGQIAVQGTLSVLLDSTLCALGPILCLTSQVKELDGCPKHIQSNILDNIAYVMPGL